MRHHSKNKVWAHKAERQLRGSISKTKSKRYILFKKKKKEVGRKEKGKTMEDLER